MNWKDDQIEKLILFYSHNSLFLVRDFWYQKSYQFSVTSFWYTSFWSVCHGHKHVEVGWLHTAGLYTVHRENEPLYLELAVGDLLEFTNDMSYHLPIDTGILIFMMTYWT